MSFRAFQRSLRPLAYGLGYLGATSIRYYSTAFVLRTPPPSAPREVPTPLVFVSSSKWDPRSQQGMRSFAAMFAERGFTCLEVDLAPPEDRTTSEALMQHFEDEPVTDPPLELSSHIHLTAIPFPPIILARESGALIAQTYISSHPASGLLLISPPSSNAALSSPTPTTTTSPLLPGPLREFDFEPKFPCAILCSEEEIPEMEKNRLWQDPGVDKLIVRDREGMDGQDGFVKIEQWLDEIGV
ncbi:uncharacterized protein LAESUDRAFT_652041 [Laetiporus sulphureus 93-53]|uniref:Uncharacterized protein n=1 Tax=Laetiporus sulphureus 93-53 TaxID=1314785 RepID=A0A165EGN7_9APHY|nr:uncharacterized protein LAESUDRAFT_652041 [Laetiporus sulphureus 93-53]KZT07015.1 hypothetical protein LAESUDRAFT_652041 [Laetiporus sulphureus 93-53]